MDKKQEFILALFAKDEIRFLTDEALKERVKQYEHIYEVMMEALTPKPKIRYSSMPSWDDAPEWADWLAQDGDGEWFWYDKRPFLPLGCSVWNKVPHSQSLSAPVSNGRNEIYNHAIERRP